MKKKIVSIVLALSMALSLTACSNSKGGSTADENITNAPAESTTDTATEAPAAPASRELKIGVSTAPQNISPFTSFTNRQPVVSYLYETLVSRDEFGNFYGIIAKNWTTEDNITYNFEIYDNVFDTAGNQIKAEDVVFSLEHARDEAANTWIVSAAVTGDYTFTVTLTNDAVSTFPTAMDRAPIVSKASYEASADAMATSSVSTAPYIVTDFVPNVSITFEKNPNYWQTDESSQNPLYKNATVDKMFFTKISEAAQQTIALETGAIDVFSSIANTEVANFLEGGRDAADFNALGYASTTSYVNYYSNQGICATDINLRQAIAHAIDKSAIVLGAFSGLAMVPTYMGAPEGMSDLTPASASADYFKYDQALAKDYLSKSTYNGEKLRLLVPNEDNHNRIAAIVQGQLMAIGLNVEIVSYDNAMFQSSFFDGSTWDISVVQMGMGDVAFVWSFLSWELTGSGAGSMGMAVKDAKLTEVLSNVLTIQGHNTENATIASDYINEMCYGQNLVTTNQYFVFRKDLGAKEVPYLNQSAQEHWLACTVFE